MKKDFIHGVFNEIERIKAQPHWHSGKGSARTLSDTAQSYQAGYIAGIARGKDKIIYALEKMNDRGLTITEALIELIKYGKNDYNNRS